MAQETEVKKRKRRGELGVLKVLLAAASEAYKTAHPEKALTGIQSVLAGQIELAAGTCRVEVQDGPQRGMVYTKAPDPAAAKLILEMGFGKAKESIEITDPTEKFKHSPQVLLVVPEGFKGYDK